VRISTEQLSALAGATGFRPDVLEKVIHLLNLLDAFQSHPFLKGKFVLKGGTALNLFIFNLPRLSVDIDLNYLGVEDRDGMLAERPKVEQAMHAVFLREGFAVRRMPLEHAGGKWSLRYGSATGQEGNLEVDLNFMFRVPLWPVTTANSRTLGSYQAAGIQLLDLHEIAGGKLAALMARRQARDLYDSHRILQMDGLDNERLRIAFVVYGAMNRKDWRTISIEDVDFDTVALIHQLAPTLRLGAIEEVGGSEDYGKQLVEECRQAMSAVLPFTDRELEFLDLLLDKGEIDSTILTADVMLQNRIQRQPSLEWKAFNVRKHKGLPY
jgi:predicted nucleotidyltransferase component of viral defense system